MRATGFSRPRNAALLCAVATLMLAACHDTPRPAAPVPAGAAPASTDVVSADALLPLLPRLGGADAPLVLDVRTPEEWAAGHVPGALNVPHQDLPARLQEFEDFREREVVVYCERGGRASVAEAALREAGFRDVRQLEGNMSGWRARGLPVERPGAP